MHIKKLHNGEDPDNKEAKIKVKMAGDAYVKENENNTAQETKGILVGVDEGQATSFRLSRSKKVWLGAAVMMVVLACIGAGVSVASSSFILHQMGFTSKGVSSKSFASRLMASTSRANNHTVPSDSWVSWLQKAGQKGPSSEHQAYFATVGAMIGVMVVVVVVAVGVVVFYVLRRYRHHHQHHHHLR